MPPVAPRGLPLPSIANRGFPVPLVAFRCFPLFLFGAVVIVVVASDGVQEFLCELSLAS